MQTSTHYNTIVIGVGSMGSSAIWHLAKRGQKVLGLEQFTTPHERGSHGGQTRIIRKAYFEHPDYVPLLERAYENWRSFESETAQKFFHRTGIVYFGRVDNENITGIRRSADLYNIAIENPAPDKVKREYPQFLIPSDFVAVIERDAGFVTPEHALRSYVNEAVRNGAVVKENTLVSEWRQEGTKVRVITLEDEYVADNLIITAGAWTARLVPRLNIRLQVTRQLIAWVRPCDPSIFQIGKFPCWFVEDPVLGTFYGFPIFQDNGGPLGIKLAHHHPGVACEADDTLENIPGEDEMLKWFLRKYIPAAGDNIIHTKHCLYTYSPDTHFIIDHLPGYDNRVVVACGFSGHGFKFVPVMGEALADLATKGSTDLPVGFLGVNRF